MQVDAYDIFFSYIRLSKDKMKKKRKENCLNIF